MSYDDISEMVDEKIFMSIPEIMELNQIDGWLDLGALSRNIFFTLLRENIINGDYEKIEKYSENKKKIKNKR